MSAQLSPDDKYALVVTAAARSDPAGKEMVSALLLTLDGTAPPATVQTVPMPALIGSFNTLVELSGQLTISGIFLENGAFKNRLLLGRTDPGSPTEVKMRLVEIANPNRAVAEATIPYGGIGILRVAEQADGQTLLIYNDGVPPIYVAGGPATAQIVLLHSQPQSGDVKVSNYNVPIPEGGIPTGSTPYFMSPVLHGNILTYDVEAFTTQPEVSSIYRLALPDAGSQDMQQPSLIFSNAWAGAEESGKTWPLPSVAGPNDFGYVDNTGTLHAHSYNSDGDVTLESGVGTIFALNASYFNKALH